MRLSSFGTLTAGSLALTLGALAQLTACSSASSTAPPTALDGGSESGSASSDAASDDGEAGGPEEQQAACEAYVLARCAKTAACGSPVAACEQMKGACPGLLFGAGSAHTIAGVKACTAVVSTTDSCSEAGTWRGDQTMPPLACDPPGTRQGHESCASASQCDSATCLGDPGKCGTCAVLAKANEDCGTGSVVCVAGTTCSPTSYVCVPARAGTACMPGNPCAPGFTCIADATMTGGTTGTCTALPKAGSPCGMVGDHPVFQGCDDEAYCQPPADFLMPSVCAPYAKLGQVCGIDSAGSYVLCGAGLTCGASSTCVLFKMATLGQACDPYTPCDPTTDCSGGQNGAGKCLPHLAPGAACGAPDAGQVQTCPNCVTAGCFPSAGDGTPATCAGSDLPSGAACGMGCLSMPLSAAAPPA